MASLYKKDIQADPEIYQFGGGGLSATLGETLSATASAPLPTQKLATYADEQAAMGNKVEAGLAKGIETGFRAATTPVSVGAVDLGSKLAQWGMQYFHDEPKKPVEMLTPEQVKKDYGYRGVSFNQPVPREVAESAAKRLDEERERNFIISRGPSGVVATGLQLGTGFLVGMTDPIFAAASVIPGIGEARVAALTGVLGSKLAARAVAGAAGGFAGNLPVVLADKKLSNALQLDYSMGDALTNLAFGSILGGGLHVAGGAIADRLTRAGGEVQPHPTIGASPEAIQGAHQAAVAQTMRGEEVNVAPIFEVDKSLGEKSPFNQWFGESKVTDESGQPLRVFHGTPADFQKFDLSQGGKNAVAESGKKGFFFTDRRKTADYYASQGDLARQTEIERAAFEKSAKKLRKAGKDDRAAEAQAKADSLPRSRTIEAHLSLQNPLVVDFKNKVFREETYSEIIDRAKVSGHDGVILKNTYDAGERSKLDAILQGRFKSENVYVAFNADQIKQAPEVADMMAAYKATKEQGRGRPAKADPLADPKQVLANAGITPEMTEAQARRRAEIVAQARARGKGALSQAQKEAAIAPHAEAIKSLAEPKSAWEPAPASLFEGENAPPEQYGVEEAEQHAADAFDLIEREMLAARDEELPANPELEALMAPPEAPAVPGKPSAAPTAPQPPKPAQSPSGEGRVEAYSKQASDQIPAGPKLNERGTPRPAGFFTIDATKLKVDAERFQFKTGGDKFGVLDKLKHIKTFSREQSGQLSAWESLEGDVYVSNGHQRVGLAKRVKSEKPATDTTVSIALYREKDGVTAEMAMAIGAAANIIEGQGDVLDMVKVAKAFPELVEEARGISDDKQRMTFDLTHVNDSALGLAYNGVVKYQYAALVGRFLPNDDLRQNAAMNLLAKADPGSIEEAASLIQQVKAEEVYDEVIDDDMFKSHIATSLVLEKAKVMAAFGKEVRQNKKLFGTLTKQAKKIEGAGNKLATDKNAALEAEAGALEQQVQAGAYMKGPISDALTKAAQDVKAGANPKTAARGFAEALSKSGALGGEGGARSGARASAGLADAADNQVGGEPIVGDAPEGIAIPDLMAQLGDEAEGDPEIAKILKMLGEEIDKTGAGVTPPSMESVAIGNLATAWDGGNSMQISGSIENYVGYLAAKHGALDQGKLADELYDELTYGDPPKPTVLGIKDVLLANGIPGPEALQEAAKLEKALIEAGPNADIFLPMAAGKQVSPDSLLPPWEGDFKFYTKEFKLTPTSAGKLKEAMEMAAKYPETWKNADANAWAKAINDYAGQDGGKITPDGFKAALSFAIAKGEKPEPTASPAEAAGNMPAIQDGEGQWWIEGEHGAWYVPKNPEGWKLIPADKASTSGPGAGKWLVKKQPYTETAEKNGGGYFTSEKNALAFLAQKLKEGEPQATHGADAKALMGLSIDEAVDLSIDNANAAWAKLKKEHDGDITGSWAKQPVEKIMLELIDGDLPPTVEALVADMKDTYGFEAFNMTKPLAQAIIDVFNGEAEKPKASFSAPSSVPGWTYYEAPKKLGGAGFPEAKQSWKHADGWVVREGDHYYYGTKSINHTNLKGSASTLDSAMDAIAPMGKPVEELGPKTWPAPWAAYVAHQLSLNDAQKIGLEKYAKLWQDTMSPGTDWLNKGWLEKVNWVKEQINGYAKLTPAQEEFAASNMTGTLDAVYGVKPEHAGKAEVFAKAFGMKANPISVAKAESGKGAAAFKTILNISAKDSGIPEEELTKLIVAAHVSGADPVDSVIAGGWILDPADKTNIKALYAMSEAKDNELVPLYGAAPPPAFPLKHLSPEEIEAKGLHGNDIWTGTDAQGQVYRVLYHDGKSTAGKGYFAFMYKTAKDDQISHNGTTIIKEAATLEDALAAVYKHSAGVPHDPNFGMEGWPKGTETWAAPKGSAPPPKPKYSDHTTQAMLRQSQEGLVFFSKDEAKRRESQGSVYAKVATPEMEAARQARRKEMGYDTMVFRGGSSFQKFQAFGMRERGGDITNGVFFTDKPAIARSYAGGESETGGGVTYPVWLRTKGFMVVDWAKKFGTQSYGGENMTALIKEARQGGYPGIIARNMSDVGGSNQTQFIVLENSAVRGWHARFDPEERFSGDYMAKLGQDQAPTREHNETVNLAVGIIKRLPPDISVKLGAKLARVEGGDVVAGYSSARKTLYLTARSLDPVGSLRHEEIHALRDLGLFTPEEWGLLETRADALRGQFQIDERYRAWLGRRMQGEELEGALREEAVAHMVAAYDAGTRYGSAIDRIIQSIKDFFDRLGSAARGMGFQTADDVIRRIESGEVGQRIAEARQPQGMMASLKEPTPEQAEVLKLLDSGASPEEIQAHPYIQRSIAVHDTLPDRFKGKAFDRDAAQYVINGETVTGYDQAVEHSAAAARAAAGVPIRQEKRGVILMGAPASGKSTHALAIAKENGAALLDADEIKKIIPGYNDGLGAGSTHLESNAILGSTFRKVMQDGDNLVIQKVGAYMESITNAAKQLRENGYHVEVVLVDVDPEEAFRRSIRRFIDTGRLVTPEYMVRDVDGNPRRNFDKLKGENYGEATYREIDNNGPMEAPSGGAQAEVADVSGDGKGGGKGVSQGGQSLPSEITPWGEQFFLPGAEPKAPPKKPEAGLTSSETQKESAGPLFDDFQSDLLDTLRMERADANVKKAKDMEQPLLGLAGCMARRG